MPYIELDPDVIAAVKARALPWVDRSPSDTLRRILGIACDQTDAEGRPPERVSERASERSLRARKADLRSLVEAGLLREGQALHLRDYAGKRVAGAEAAIAGGNKLRFGGHLYSMSSLAAKLLKKAGYAADAVRGPAHWAVADGRTVLEVWQEYSNNASRASR